MPKLAAATWTAAAELAWPFTVTVTVPLPMGAFDGMMAVIWFADPPVTGAVTFVPLTLTCTLAPAGPRLLPLITNVEPCAMLPLGRPGFARLAAFNTPLSLTDGVGGVAAPAVKV